MFCPDLSSLGGEVKIEGDPYYYRRGYNFALIAASCKAKASLFGVSAEGCKDEDEQTKTYINNIRIVYKLVTQYFNLENY